MDGISFTPDRITTTGDKPAHLAHILPPSRCPCDRLDGFHVIPPFRQGTHVDTPAQAIAAALAAIIDPSRLLMGFQKNWGEQNPHKYPEAFRNAYDLAQAHLTPQVAA